MAAKTQTGSPPHSESEAGERTPENGQIELRSHFLQKILIEDTMLGTYLGCATQKLIVSDGKENFYPSLKEQSLPKCQPPIWDSIGYMDFSFWSH